MENLDSWKYRELFPQLQTQAEGFPLVYLDTAATALKPNAVIDRYSQFMREEYATVNRSLYGLAQKATADVYATRRLVGELVGAEAPEQVIFTRGTTDSINLVALAMQQELGPGDEIVVTAQEHHSNLVPWQLVCQRSGATLRILSLLPSGQWDLSTLAQTIGPKCRLVACSAVSNVLGVWNPVDEIVAAARKVGAVVLLDAAQAVGAYRMNLQELGVDFMAFSAHKLYGPTGLGVLVGTKEALESLPPVQGGGDMIDRVELTHSTFAPLPQRLEAGTPPIAEIISWAPALRLMMEITPERIGKHTETLQRLCEEELIRLGFRLINPLQKSKTLCTMIHPDWHPSDLTQLLACRNIAVRSGHLCAQPLLRHLGITHVIRASFGLYSSKKDVQALLKALSSYL